MKNKLLTLLVMILCVSWASAQVSISGTVRSSGDNLPLIAVDVLEVGTTNGTFTDENGKFNLTVQEGAKVSVSYIGYQTQVLQVNGPQEFDVVLSEGAQLDEVVVTALGITRERKSLGYAVSKLGGDEVNLVKDYNPVNSLVGKVAGLVVSSPGAGVGSASRIVIRGNNSITGNNQPLVVIDGVPIDNSGSNTGGSVYNTKVSGGGITDVNAEDIESMSVLKGPNAAALYGSRASNGVILITTKKGRKGKGIGVSLTSNLTWNSPMVLPDYQNEYGQGTEGNIPDDVKGSTGSWGPKLDGSQQPYYTGDTRAYSAVPNNISDFFETGLQAINSVALEGGSENYTMRFSYTNNNTKSIVPNSSLLSNNFNLRGTSNLTDRLSLDAKITYFNQDLNNRPNLGTEGVLSYVYDMPRNVSLADLKNYQDLSKSFDAQSYSNLGANPYWILFHDVDADERNRVLGFAKLNYKINDWLSAFVRVGTDVLNSSGKGITQYGHHFVKTGRMSFATSKSAETNADFLLTGNKYLNEDFSVTASVGGNLSHRTYRGVRISGSDFKIPTRATIANLKTLDTPGFTPTRTHKLNSMYGTVSFGYKNWLYLDVTGRNDWSSTLPAANRSYFYPSVSLSAVVSDAMAVPSWMSFLKVRGSWAEVGNDTGPYQIANYFNLAGNGYLGRTQVGRTGVKFNDDLKPESINSLEGGLEMRLFNDRLFVDFSVYDIKSQDLIFDVPVDASTGYSRFRENIGEVQNTGVELLIGGTPIQTSDFSWESSFNYAKNKNTLNELAEGLERYSMNTTNSGNVTIQATVGGGYGDIFGTTWRKNDAGQIVLSADGVPLASTEKVLLGNAQPDWIGGWSNTFRYKDLVLNALISGRFGGQVFSQTNASLNSAGVTTQSLEYRDGGIVVDGVIKDGDSYVANTKKISAQRYWGAVSGIASENVFDQTNIRLREMSLGYRIPKSILANSFIQSATVSLIGRNLAFLYKKIDHVDPEASLGTSNTAQGIMSFNVPTSRSVGFSVNLKF